jgi:HK97 family phage major capsid protein
MASATAVTAADLFGIFYTLEAQHRAGATWVMPSLISKEINNINATSAGVHSVNDLNTPPAEFLLGKRVVNNDVSGNGLATSITANDEIAVFGDFRNYYIFDRIGFTIRRNDSLYMENDQIGFFGTRRGDGQVGLAAAFKILKAAAS